MAIKDSGERREFSTGAVRDIQEGKGRCDLMPLDVLSDMYMIQFGRDCHQQMMFGQLFMFTHSGDCLHLQNLLGVAVTAMFGDHPTMLLEVAKHFEEGAKKYGEHNWQKGIPVRCYIDSAVRHYLKWLRDDEDEPHDRAFCWNILCAIWTCKHKPELNDYAAEPPAADPPTVEEMDKFLEEFCEQRRCKDCPLLNTSCDSSEEDDVIKNYNTVKEYLANECNTDPGNP